MVGLINLMNERRALLRPGGLWTMAGGAMSVELSLASLQFRRNGGSPDGGFWLGRVAGDDGKHPRKSQHGQVQHGRPRSSTRLLLAPRAGSVNCSRSIRCVRRSVMRR